MAEPWAGVEMTWTGVDGSVWRPLESESLVTLEAVRGLHLPAWDAFSQSAPGMAGQRHTGSRAKPREVRWTVAVHSRAGTDEWVTTDQAWWRSLDPDRPGTWEVSTRGISRRLRLRLDASDDDMPADPTLYGDLAYGIDLVADQPFWEADPVQRLFVSTPGTPFFAASPGVISISAGNTLAVAGMDNLGDEPAWPVWTATGPMSSLTVGLGGKTVVAPITLTSSQALVVDSRPDSQGITRWSFVFDDDGMPVLTPGTDVDMVSAVTQVAFAPVPPGTSVPLTVLATATTDVSTVGVEITPLYRRAW